MSEADCWDYECTIEHDGRDDPDLRHPKYYCKRSNCCIRQGYEVASKEIIYNATIHFGKHKGKTLKELPVDYQQWICNRFDGMLKRWIQICLMDGKYTASTWDESRC